jgi:hypothetical protein
MQYNLAIKLFKSLELYYIINNVFVTQRLIQFKD